MFKLVRDGDIEGESVKVTELNSGLFGVDIIFKDKGESEESFIDGFKVMNRRLVEGGEVLFNAIGAMKEIRGRGEALFFKSGDSGGVLSDSDRGYGFKENGEDGFWVRFVSGGEGVTVNAFKEGVREVKGFNEGRDAVFEGGNGRELVLLEA